RPPTSRAASRAASSSGGMVSRANLEGAVILGARFVALLSGSGKPIEELSPLRLVARAFGHGERFCGYLDLELTTLDAPIERGTASHRPAGRVLHSPAHVQLRRDP